MQFFGIVSLLLAVSFIVWQYSESVKPESNFESSKQTYQESVDMARDAVNALEEVSDRSGDTIRQSAPTAHVSVYANIDVPIDSLVLNLSGRGLSGSLKAEVRQVTNLKTLDISHNNFTGIPAEVGHLSKLEVLNVSYNPITGLPYELGDLKNLKVLDLRGTSYSEVDLTVIKQTLPSTTQILVD